MEALTLASRISTYECIMWQNYYIYACMYVYVAETMRRGGLLKQTRKISGTANIE